MPLREPAREDLGAGSGFEVGADWHRPGLWIRALGGVLEPATAALDLLLEVPICSSPTGTWRIPCPWMSSSEIRALQAEIAALRARLEVQEERIKRLEEGGAARSEFAEESVNGSEIWEGQSLGGQSSLGSYSVVDVPDIVQKEDVGARLALAKACGAFLKRALEGDFRGGSGRDKLRLGSRVYLVVADYSGQRFDPPKVFFDFGSVRSICKSGNQCGRSVFLGFASQWEAKEAVREAGFVRPAELA